MAVQDYRLFFIGGDGHIVGAEPFEAPNDQAAIAYAAEAEHPYALELWRRATMIKRFARPPEAYRTRHRPDLDCEAGGWGDRSPSRGRGSVFQLTSPAQWGRGTISQHGGGVAAPARDASRPR